MSRFKLASLALTSAVAVAGLSAPAQAATVEPAIAASLYGTYSYNYLCLDVGGAGKTNGLWSSYYCYTVVPAGPGIVPGQYQLWVLYS